MARKIEKMPDTSKYPWAEWLDGNAWELSQGEDFACPAAVFYRTVYSAAKRRGRVAEIRVQGDKVYVQAHLNGAPS
jgi:hypothetical protein